MTFLPVVFPVHTIHKINHIRMNSIQPKDLHLPCIFSRGASVNDLRIGPESYIVLHHDVSKLTHVVHQKFWSVSRQNAHITSGPNLTFPMQQNGRLSRDSSNI